MSELLSLGAASELKARAHGCRAWPDVLVTGAPSTVCCQSAGASEAMPRRAGYIAGMRTARAPQQRRGRDGLCC